YRHDHAGPSAGGRPLNLSSVAVLAGIAVDAWLIAFVGLRGRRPWLQATYAACALSYLVLGAAYVGTNEHVLGSLDGPAVLGVMLGIVLLIIAGPVYWYEVDVLRGTTLAGANIASPIALACFALVALQADPFPISIRPARGRTGPGRIPSGDAIAFEETRPNYAVHAARGESADGRATLVIGRTPPASTPSGAAHATIPPSRNAAVQALATASEFLGSTRGGLVVLEGLADLAVLSEWAPTLEMVVRLRHVSRSPGSTVVLSTSRVPRSARRALGDLQLSWWTLPDPAQEIEAILAQSFGGGGPRLLAAFCRSHGLRREDLTTDHMPALLEFRQQCFCAVF